jgi:hypothetical protein
VLFRKIGGSAGPLWVLYCWTFGTAGSAQISQHAVADVWLSPSSSNRNLSNTGWTFGRVPRGISRSHVLCDSLFDGSRKKRREKIQKALRTFGAAGKVPSQLPEITSKREGFEIMCTYGHGPAPLGLLLLSIVRPSQHTSEGCCHCTLRA